MPLGVEGWWGEREEAPNEWLLLVPKPNNNNNNNNNNKGPATTAADLDKNTSAPEVTR